MSNLEPDTDRSWIANRLIPCLAAVLVAVSMAHGFEQSAGREWTRYGAELEAVRSAFLMGGELPLWLPSQEGGYDAFAPTDSVLFSPLTLLCLLLGVSNGIRVFFALLAGFGSLGCVRLAANLQLRPVGRIAFALLWVLSSPLAFSAVGGAPGSAIGLALLPWLVLCVLRDSRTALLTGGALLALDLYGGDLRFFTHALFLGLVASLLAVMLRRPRPLVRLSLLFATAMLLAAPKLVPMALFRFETAPPAIAKTVEAPGLSPSLLAHAFLDREGVRTLEEPGPELEPEPELELELETAPEPRRDAEIDWLDRSPYLGPLALLLAAMGLPWLAIRQQHAVRSGEASSRDPVSLLGQRRTLLAIVLSAAFFLWLSTGREFTPSLWAALQPLPFSSLLRDPADSLLYVSFGVVLLAGVSLSRLESSLGRILGVQLTAMCTSLLVLVVVADIYPVSRKIYRHTFTFSQPQSQTGPSAPTQPAFSVEARLLKSGAVLVPEVRPRTIRVPLPGEGADILVVDQRWSAGWRATAPAEGAELEGDALRVDQHANGNIAVSVPEGLGRVTLHYTTPGLGLGLAIGGLGLVLVAAAAGQLPLRPKRPSQPTPPEDEKKSLD